MVFNLNLEERLLAGLIKYPNSYHDICSFINENDFASDENKVTKTIFNILKDYCEKNQKVDYLILSERIKDLGISFAQDINISDYIYSLTLRSIDEDKILDIAKELKKVTVRREIYNAAKKVALLAKNAPSSLSFEDIISNAEKEFNSQLNVYDISDNGFYNIYEEMEGYIEYLGENPEGKGGLEGPFERVNQLYGSLLRPGNITVIAARSGVGKMQPLRCKVLTPHGFVKMSEINAGDEVITPKGKRSKVLKTFDHKDKLIFKINLNDGRSTYCGADHLWKVKLVNNVESIECICDTNTLLYKLAKGYKIFLPNIEEISISGKDSLSIESLAKVCLFKEDFPSYIYHSLDYEQRCSFVRFILEKIGFVSRSSKKYGKKYYINALFNNLKFCNKFREVLFSLGFLAYINKSGKSYKIYISGKNIEKITSDVLLNKNKKSVEHLCKDNDLFISDITVMTRREDCRCIEIDDPDHLYVTDDFIVTHNTRFCLDYCTKIAEIHDVPILHFDNGEMSKEELMIRQCSALSGVSAHLIEKGLWRRAGNEVVERVRSSYKKVKDLKFYYHSVGGYSMEQMISVLKRFYFSKIGRGAPMVFSFDYIKPRHVKDMMEWQYIGYMLDNFKTAIHKEILHEGEPTISMLTSVQANRSGIVGNRNARNVQDDEGIVAGSDKIIQYCSHLFILREKTLDELELEQQNFGTHKLIKKKSRHLGDMWQRAIHKVQMPDLSLVENCIHLDMEGFNVRCLGDQVDLVEMLNGDRLEVPNENPEFPILQ